MVECERLIAPIVNHHNLRLIPSSGPNAGNGGVGFLLVIADRYYDGDH